MLLMVLPLYIIYSRICKIKIEEFDWEFAAVLLFRPVGPA